MAPMSAAGAPSSARRCGARPSRVAQTSERRGDGVGREPRRLRGVWHPTSSGQRAPRPSGPARAVPWGGPAQGQRDANGSNAIGRGLRRCQQQARGGCGPPSAGGIGALGGGRAPHQRGARRERRERRAGLAAAAPRGRAGPGGCAGAGCCGAAQQRRPRRSEGARARRGRAERRPARNRRHGGAAALLRLPLRAAVRTAPARLRLYLRVRVRVCPTPSWGRRVACGRSLRARCCRTSVASVYCRSQEQQGCISAARI